MSNPSGTNQFGGFGNEPAYGEIKRSTELQREAPMSGAPLATHATEAPRRSARRTRKKAGAVAPVGPQAAPATPPVDPQAEVLSIGQALATHPDSSDLLLQIVSQGS